MVREDLYRVPSAFEVVAPVATGHDNSEHLLIAYSVVPLRWGHAARPKSNRVLMTLIGAAFHAARSTFRAAADLVLLLQDDASYGKTRGIRLKMDWPSKIEVG